MHQIRYLPTLVEGGTWRKSGLLNCSYCQALNPGDTTQWTHARKLMTEIARGLRDVILTETRLSMIDGLAGKLIIAGFPLEELAPKATAEEAIYLLWNDHLPNKEEL